MGELLSLSSGEKSRILNMLANALSQSDRKDKEAVDARARAIQLRKEVEKVYNGSDQSEKAYDLLVTAIFW